MTRETDEQRTRVVPVRGQDTAHPDDTRKRKHLGFPLITSKENTCIIRRRMKPTTATRSAADSTA